MSGKYRYNIASALCCVVIIILIGSWGEQRETMAGAMKRQGGLTPEQLHRSPVVSGHVLLAARHSSGAMLSQAASGTIPDVAGTEVLEGPEWLPIERCRETAGEAAPRQGRWTYGRIMGGLRESAQPSKVKWPLWKIETVPVDCTFVAPEGKGVVDFDVTGDGRYVVVLLKDLASGETSLHLWDFQHRPIPLAARGPHGKQVEAVFFSKFGSGLYVLAKGAGEWRIELHLLELPTWAPIGAGEPGDLIWTRTLYRSKDRLRRLMSPYVLYAAPYLQDMERVYFGREDEAGRYQILSVRADGSGVYEFSSPTGELSELTAPEIRALAGRPEDSPDPMQEGPAVQKAASALPLSFHPYTGEFIWEGEDKTLYTNPYSISWWAGNWRERHPVPNDRPGAVVVYTPNGYYLMRWDSGQKGVEFLHPNGEVAGVIAQDLQFASLPVVAPNGRTLIAEVRDGGQGRLQTLAVAVPLAGVRYLDDIPIDRADFDLLARQGIISTPSDHKQIYEYYEQLRYDDACPIDRVGWHESAYGRNFGLLTPVFASIDGFLEVLHAGFQAVFMLVERDVSRPRLEAFLQELKRSADTSRLDRVSKIAQVTRAMLKGDYTHPEGQLVLKEAQAFSALHTAPRREQIDFQDFHPRGPYTATPELSNYFRAFKYVNLLQLLAKELVPLRQDKALVEAWDRWVKTQQHLLRGTRRQGILAPGAALASHVRTDCIPDRVKKQPLQVFPLFWGIDNEVLESTVMRERVAPDCSVPDRVWPSGLDLLTALGSHEAQNIQAAFEYPKYPQLKTVHEGLKSRFAQPLGTTTVSESWFRLLQLLSTDEYVPEGVSKTLWRRRLLQTALASWTGFRHTTVLVMELAGAECGGPFEGFERLTREPPRGAVDPLPQSWEHLANLLHTLAEQAKQVAPEGRIAEHLLEAAHQARDFGRMASAQMQGEPLSEKDYEQIQLFARLAEHPFLLLKSALSPTGGLQEPDPMTKIVDVFTDSPAQKKFLHAAIGTPLMVKVLLGDRGILVPVSGAVYSYYEVLSEKRLNDDEWRQMLPQAKRPPWIRFDLESQPSAER